MEKYKCYAFLYSAVNDEVRSQLEKYTKCEHSTGYANCYVAIPNEHPLYGMCYGMINIKIHGGLTFSGSFESMKKEIIKNPDKVEYLDGEFSNDCWVFGFDTLHFGDNIHNRSREWCIMEVTRLKEILENWIEIVARRKSLLKLWENGGIPPK